MNVAQETCNLQIINLCKQEAELHERQYHGNVFVVKNDAYVLEMNQASPENNLVPKCPSCLDVVRI